MYITILPADKERRCPVCLSQANEAADSSFSKEGRKAEYQMSSAAAYGLLTRETEKARCESAIQNSKKQNSEITRVLFDALSYVH